MYIFKIYMISLYKTMKNYDKLVSADWSTTKHVTKLSVLWISLKNDRWSTNPLKNDKNNPLNHPNQQFR